MASAQAEQIAPSHPQRMAENGLPLAWLIAALLGLLAFDNLLVLRFLGKSWTLVGPIMAIGITTTVAFALRSANSVNETRIRWGALVGCFGIAGILLIVGGEGRLLYANTDWQVRDAVLADIGSHAWPFAYSIDGMPSLLRAPLGMYILPALIGGSSQCGLDGALLACNTLMLGLTIASGSCLFPNCRARLLAMTVFVVFSGLDILGTLMMRKLGAHPSFDHLEAWAAGLQYSSNITLIFWVPHHAIAGWLCALFYLLWQQKKISLGSFAAVIPLIAIWSPLAIMGAVPFAALAGARTLLNRTLAIYDVAQVFLALAISMPSLVYLRAGADGLPNGVHTLAPLLYLISLILEVAPYLVATIMMRPASRFGLDTLAIVAGCLLLMPLYKIGGSIDFQMRASIMPLGLLTLFVADALTRAEVNLWRRVLLVAILCVGAVTGAAELRRAFNEGPSPAPRCSVMGVWFKQTYTTSVPLSTYFAPLPALPAFLRPQMVPLLNVAHDPADCWERAWRSSRS